MKNKDSNSWLLIALASFALLVLIVQFITYHYLEGKAHRYIEDAYEKIEFIPITEADSMLLNKKSEIASVLAARFKKLEDEIQQQERTLKQEYFYFVVIGLPLTLIGLITFLIGSFRFLQKEAEVTVKKQILESFGEKEATISNMIEKQDKEVSLFKNTKIAIWGKEKSNETIRQVLANVNFNMYNIIDYENVKGGQEYQVLLINNETAQTLISSPREGDNDYDKNLKRQSSQWNEIKELIEKQSESVCIFYYCSSQVHFPMSKIEDIDLQARINFATNPSQIYGNLLNTLKYQDYISKK